MSADAGRPGPRAIYVCGPMTGLPDYNRPAFDAAAADLRAVGFEVHNPAEISREVERIGFAIDDVPRSWYLRRALAMLLACSAVATLHGHEEARGAVLELAIAEQLGMPVEPLHRWIS